MLRSCCRCVGWFLQRTRDHVEGRPQWLVPIGAELCSWGLSRQQGRLRRVGDVLQRCQAPAF